nr:uncharacterized protein LOC129381611 [Dermacentor andersoni]
MTRRNQCKLQDQNERQTGMKFGMALALLVLALVPFVDGGGSSSTPEPLDPREEQERLCNSAGICTSNRQVMICLFEGESTKLGPTMCGASVGLLGLRFSE